MDQKNELEIISVSKDFGEVLGREDISQMSIYSIKELKNDLKDYVIFFDLSKISVFFRYII